eukprot:TRINITY_DN50059_c0_g1_i1.p1 TRINITY_DN50059_c0_g1~~TRINITY_DN50059_c0_g1_i1.p1  ORF type:complete len:359 (-),score=77.80 TRINITY_DN50059_c0_g1_i1:110-1153(-)
MTNSDDQEPDALDQKGNRYYRRKLLQREFLSHDLMKLTFELPPRVSLKSLGFDIGLGDFVRMRPYAEEHKKLVENPAGGRAYSPVLPPDTEGKFGFIVKAYGPEDKVVGVSSLLKQVPVGTELLVTNHTEHVFWKERNRGYYCNSRNIEISSDGFHYIGLIAFGIGITEIAPVALSELLDASVARVTILWANRRWSDAEWVWKDAAAREEENLVHKFFAQQGKYGDRLQVKHILSQEDRPEASFRGRITGDVLKKAFLDGVPKEKLKFLAVGTTAMINFAYEELGKLDLDISQKEHWEGSNLLYRKCPASLACADRRPSPLLAALCPEGNKRSKRAEEESPSKRVKV